jgi:hypothetical protein
MGGRKHAKAGGLKWEDYRLKEAMTDDCKAASWTRSTISSLTGAQAQHRACEHVSEPV